MDVRGLRQIDILNKCQPYCKKYDIRLNRNDLSQYVSGKVLPKQNKLTILAEALGVSEVWLMGYDVPMIADKTPNTTTQTLTFPVIGEIAAGYDLFAEPSYEADDTVEIPLSYLKGKARSDFMVLRVTGDSMYPMYQSADIVLIERFYDRPTSGQIYACRYKDCATIKRVELNDDREEIRFVPINPMYPPYTLQSDEKDNFEIIGRPIYLIREIKV